MTHTRSLQPEEWQLWKHLRLQALADSPDAFGDTWERAAKQSDGDWREFAASSTFPDRKLLLAERLGRPVGMARILLSESDSSRASLFSMWVMSSERGVGVGRALVDAAIKWAKSKGVSEITVHVTVGNDEAKRLYEAAGFVDSGRREPLRPGSSLHEEVMVMRLC